MNIGSYSIQIAVAGLLTILLLGYLFTRQYVVKGRVRRYNDGVLPDTTTLGVVYYGLSTETGRLKKREGALFATKEAMVFISQGLKQELVEIPWLRIDRWETVGKFRERPIDKKIVSLVVESEVGAAVAMGFAMPRPEYWTALVDVALKSVKNP